MITKGLTSLAPIITNRSVRDNYRLEDQSGFHLGLGDSLGVCKHIAIGLATPTYVDYTPFYMLVHYSRSIVTYKL